MAIKYECADDLIPVGHKARLVWDVVSKLDLSDFQASIKAREGTCGRDATDPALLISLWLYATIRGVGSARELDRLCKESRPYQWLCGGVSLNHHTLSDFRVGFGKELDQLLSQMIAALVSQKLVKVYRIAQDGLRVRACAGSASFKTEAGLARLREESEKHVAELKALLEAPGQSASLSAKQKAARQRAAREKQERLEKAMELMPELKERKERERKKRKKAQPDEARVSTTDPEARVMKMANGGFNPAVNVQMAVDTQSRAIVGVDVTDSGVDSGQAEAMREQVERRSGQKVVEHLMDGGYLSLEEIERAEGQGVVPFVPPKPARKKDKRASAYEPRPEDSEEIRRWRVRMGSEQGKEMSKLRSSTIETVNADARARGMTRLLVRGLCKGRCVALWFALAYNVMHFGQTLLG